MAEHLTARIEKLRIEGRISAETMHGIKSVDWLDPMFDAVIFGLQKRLLAADTTESTRRHTEEFTYPANSRQHFKKEFLAWKWVPVKLRRYVGRRWPVRNTVVDVPCRIEHITTRMCPHVAVPDNVSHMEWLRPSKPVLSARYYDP